MILTGRGFRRRAMCLGGIRSLSDEGYRAESTSENACRQHVREDRMHDLPPGVMLTQKRRL